MKSDNKEIKNKKKSTEEEKENSKKKKTAFTLIELLAVIIILGVIMLIAIPSVTKYISESRKDAYVATARRYIESARTKVNEGDLGIYDTDATYYIPISCIKMETGEGKTPYGEFSKAYVVTVYNGDGYNYFFTGTDTSKTGVRRAISYDTLNKRSIEPDVYDEDIKSDIGIGGRSKIVIFNEDCSAREDSAPNTYMDLEGNEIPVGEIPGHEYFNSNKNKYYSSLQSVINDASSGDVIKVMTYVEETSPITIPNTLSSIKIDFNGNTIHFDYEVQNPITNNSNLILVNKQTDYYALSLDMWHSLINNGTLEVNDNVSFSAEIHPIENHGTLNIKGGNVGSQDADGIENFGTLNVSGGSVGGYSSGIRNSNGTVNITGGEIGGAYYGLFNCSTCTATLSGDANISGRQYTVANEGTFIATGGTIDATRGWGTNGLTNSGTATLSNVTIEAESSSSGYSTYGIRNYSSGNLTINSATIKARVTGDAYSCYGISNEGNMLINNVDLSATTSKYNQLDATGIQIKGGNTTILEGKIVAHSTAISTSGSNYKLTIGKDDGNVSTTNPEIYASGRSGIGISLGTGSSGTVNIYDGIIKYANDVRYCVWGSGAATINYPTGYTLYKVFNNPLGTGYLIRQ